MQGEMGGLGGASLPVGHQSLAAGVDSRLGRASIIIAAVQSPHTPPTQRPPSHTRRLPTYRNTAKRSCAWMPTQFGKVLPRPRRTQSSYLQVNSKP